MKVVLDTNVLVSGFLNSQGPCGRILDLVLEDQLALSVDDRVVAEYHEVCHRPELRLPEDEIDRVIDFIAASAEPVVAAPLDVELPDPDDLPFLEVATSSSAYLITGNRRHFPKRLCRDARILTPRELIDSLRTEG